MSYGDGAVMGVPAHDERDFAFATKYGLPIRQVVARATARAFAADRLAGLVRRQERGPLRQFRATTTAWTTQAAVDAIAGRPRGARAWARRRPAGACATGASRASATGARRSPSSTATPAAPVPVPDEDLPVVLPEDLRARRQRQPAATSDDRFLELRLPEVRQAGAARDRHDGHLRRLVRGTTCATARPDSAEQRWSTTRTDYWMPMDQYIGGIEHAILHLLYARFWTKVMRDLGPASTGRRALHPACSRQGMVLNHIYSRTRRAGRHRVLLAARGGERDRCGRQGDRRAD
jgi:leucyl-tRNA synthetase